MIWVLLPVLAAVQAFIPILRPTPEEGYRNWTIAIILAVELYLIFAERHAWRAVMELVSPPEISILRHLGIYRNRRAFLLLGLLEVLDLYSDLTFPILAWVCDADITERWRFSWQRVPVLGSTIKGVQGALRFWGVAALCTSINVLVAGWWGIASIQRYVARREANCDERRISGEVFYDWARSSETAIMPSVAMLCEEMAEQRQWMLDENKKGQTATQGREDLALGKLDEVQLEGQELYAHEVKERVEHARRHHYLVLLLVKVVIGNIFSLWLQGTFLMLNFKHIGLQARVKILISITISMVAALVRCTSAILTLGTLGCVFSLVVMCFIAWTVAQVYFAHTCVDHAWTLSSGCVDYPG